MNYKNNIEELKIDGPIAKILIDNNIKIIEDLWGLKRKQLKTFGLSDSQISHIIIKLQLVGMDLNHKSYNCD